VRLGLIFDLRHARAKAKDLSHDRLSVMPRAAFTQRPESQATAAFNKAVALTAFSSGLIGVKAVREASPVAAWTDSKPAPRLLLWPVRPPVMRWPKR
jgi:hypothetical protein